MRSERKKWGVSGYYDYDLKCLAEAIWKQCETVGFLSSDTSNELTLYHKSACGTVFKESHSDINSVSYKAYSTPHQATAKQPYWIHRYRLAPCLHERLNISGLLACWSSVWRGEARPSSRASSRRTTASSVSITETCETSALNSKTAAHRTHCWALVVLWTFAPSLFLSRQSYTLLSAVILSSSCLFSFCSCQCTGSSAARHCAKLTSPY